MVNDIVFNEHYNKKTQVAIEQAFHAGKVQGISLVMTIANRLSQNQMKLINFNEIVSSLINEITPTEFKDPEIVNQSSNETKSQEQPVRRKPVLEIVK